jgi:hypothetical protein
MKIESKSYIDAMHGILSHKGWATHSKPMLSGMTVTGFRFTVNHRLTADSSTAYNWIAENFLAADFLGITSSQQAGFSFDATFPLYQMHAVSVIKESIDRGMGAVFWKDRFVIAAGYDDKEQAIYYSDGSNDEHQTLSYANFGINVSPYWYYQVFEDRIDLDESSIYKESFMQAIYKWETHDPMLPENQYACGRSAYDTIIKALQTGDYDREGAREVFNCYAASKRDIRLYVETLQRIWPRISTAVDYYTRLAQLFGQIVEITSKLGDYKMVETRYTTDLIQLFMDAQQTEEKAIRSIKSFMRETIDNRYNDIALR